MRLDPLQDQLQRVYDNLGFEQFDEVKGNVKIEDVRAACLMTWKSDISNNILILNVIATMNETIAVKTLPESFWRSVIGLSDPTVPLVWLENNLSQYLRLALVTMLQFRIENMIVNVLNTLDKTKVTRRYEINAEKILGSITVDNERESLKILKVLQAIRNSLHSNGIHNNADFSVTIDGVLFDFKRGQSVQCAGWAHIALAIRAVVDVLERMLNSPEIKNLAAPITDRFIES